MIRFAFTFFLLTLVGCQVASQSPKPATSGKQFWGKTAKIFKPLMPDTSKDCKESGSIEHEGRFALNRSHSDILPINHTSNSLYKPGSIFPSLLLDVQGQDKNVVTVEPSASMALTNPLQIQSGDSESLQGLLREIAIVPVGKRKVDDAKLTELLDSFRNDMMDSEVEDESLALLRKRILPESKSSAPLPSAELAESKRSNKKYEVPYGDDFEDEPIRQPAMKRKLPNLDEEVVAQNTAATPTPVYPSLTQLPNAAPGVTQASYQTLYPPNPAVTGYGAGDWQAPTRLAIEQLRYAIEQTPNGRTVANEMRLRMLEMLLGNKSEAARPMQSADKTVNEFMGNQVLGFAALLDETAPDSRGKYISAAYRFNEGLLGLQVLCPVLLKNVTFVKDWVEYGQFLPHPTREFYPGESFTVYLEIENLVVNRSKAAEGYEFGAAVKYEIWDSNAKVVANRDIGKSTGSTLSRKRDFCLGFPDTLPTNLSPGQYNLRISVTDLNDDAMRYAEEQIPFRVVPSQGTE